MTLLIIVSHDLFVFLIQVMENLQTLTNLQELWLGRNRIKAVNLCGLTCIKKISLQSNRLTSMIGFEVFNLISFSPQILYRILGANIFFFDID